MFRMMLSAEAEETKQQYETSDKQSPAYAKLEWDA